MYDVDCLSVRDVDVDCDDTPSLLSLVTRERSAMTWEKGKRRCQTCLCNVKLQYDRVRQAEPNTNRKGTRAF